MLSDESGSDSDSVESTSSSYSSLSDFVIDIQNSDINGETPGMASGGTLEITLLSKHMNTIYSVKFVFKKYIFKNNYV